MKQEERRNYSRVKFDAEIALLIGEDSHPAHLADISLNGALIQFDGASPIQVEEKCRLQINLNASELVLTIDSKAVFSKDDQVGLQFLEIEIDSLTHLRRLLELNVGDPDKVKNELFFLATHHNQS